MKLDIVITPDLVSADMVNETTGYTGVDVDGRIVFIDANDNGNASSPIVLVSK